MMLLVVQTTSSLMHHTRDIYTDVPDHTDIDVYACIRNLISYVISSATLGLINFSTKKIFGGNSVIWLPW